MDMSEDALQLLGVHTNLQLATGVSLEPALSVSVPQKMHHYLSSFRFTYRFSNNNALSCSTKLGTLHCTKGPKIRCHSLPFHPIGKTRVGKRSAWGKGRSTISGGKRFQ